MPGNLGNLGIVGNDLIVPPGRNPGSAFGEGQSTAAGRATATVLENDYSALCRLQGDHRCCGAAFKEADFTVASQADIAKSRLLYATSLSAVTRTAKARARSRHHCPSFVFHPTTPHQKSRFLFSLIFLPSASTASA